MESLYLHDTAIGPPGLEALAAAMESNETLTTLDLGMNVNGGVDSGADGAAGAAGRLLEVIQRRLQRNKLAPKPPPKPPPKLSEPAELLPATAGSRASQAAHRRLERMRVGR